MLVAAAAALSSEFSGGVGGGLDANDAEISDLNGSVRLLVFGMIAWLGTITVTAVAIFVVVTLRLRRASQALDDAEMGSLSTVSSKRSARSNPTVVAAAGGGKTGPLEFRAARTPVHAPNGVRGAATEVKSPAEFGPKFGGAPFSAPVPRHRDVTGVAGVTNMGASFERGVVLG